LASSGTGLYVFIVMLLAQTEKGTFTDFTPACQPSRPWISRQLRCLMDSDLSRVLNTLGLVSVSLCSKRPINSLLLYVVVTTQDFLDFINAVTGRT